MVLLKSAKAEGVLPVVIGLATVACPYMFNAIIFHGEPVVTDSHNLAGQQGSTSMSSKLSCISSIK